MSSVPIIDPRLQKALLIRAAADFRRRKDSLEQASAMRASFRKFVPSAWGVVEPAKPLVKAWHIDAIADHMQAVADGQIKNLLINVPPGSAKSVLVSVMFPAWQWTRNPGWRSTFASYDSGLSTRDSVRCRDLITSNWYRDTFQPQWSLATDQNEKTYYVNSAKGFRVSTSVGGRGTGWRSDFTGADDLLNVSDQFSDAALEKCVTWFDTVWYNRMIDMRSASRAVIMQRISDRDISGHLLRRGGWEHLVIPMEYDPTRSRVTVIGWEDPRKTKGELMFPPMFPQAVVDDTKKTLGAAAWAGQYQQSPSPDGGGILKSHKWNYWQPRGMGLPPVRVKMPDGTIQERIAIDLPDTFDLELQTWDLPFKDLKTSDYACGQVHCVRGADRFIRDQIHARMDLPATIAAIRTLTGRNPNAHLKLIEDKANGPAVIQSLKHEISGLVEVNPEGNKVARAAAGSVEQESGNWYLPHPMLYEWVGNPENPTESGFIAESVMFPFGAYDDRIDAWSQGAIRIQKEKIGGVFGVSEQDIRVEPFDLKTMATWPRLYGMHVDYRDIGAIWITRQPQTNQHYLYAEYSAPVSDPAQQAAAIMKTAGGCRGFLVPDAGTRELKDGYALIRKYTLMGLKLESIQEHLDTSIIDFSDAIRSGKLKIFGNLASFFSNYRMYRRAQNGKLATEGVGVILASLVAWKARDKMREPTDPHKADVNKQLGGGSSWMSG